MALNIISNVQLDMKAPNTVIVYANQYDSAGSVRAQLLNSGESWAVPAGAKAVVMFKKSDKIGGFYDVTEFGVAAVEIDSDRSVIYINYDPQVLTTAGRVAVQINFYQNDQRLSSFAFYTDVQASAVTSGEIASSWLFNILSQEIAQTLTVATTPQAMTDWLEANITQETGYVIDNTLTVAGAASDAQATGKMVTVSNLNPNTVANKVWVKKTPAEIQIPTCEELDEVKSALRYVADETLRPLTFDDLVVTSGEYINQNGEITQRSNYYHSGYIPVSHGDVVTMNLTGIQNVTAVIAAYNSVKEYIKAKSAYNNGSGSASGSIVIFSSDYTVPEGISYIRISYANASTNAVSVPRQKNKLEKRIEDIEEFDESLLDDVIYHLPDLLFNNSGYVNMDGAIATDDRFTYTDFIEVIPGSTIQYKITGVQNITSVIAAYNSSKTFDKNNSIYTQGSGATYSIVWFTGSYVVPQNVKYVRISKYITPPNADELSLPVEVLATVKLEKDIENLEEDVAKLDNDLSETKDSLYELSEKTHNDVQFTRGTYIKADGKEAENANGYVSERIYPQHGTNIVYTIRGVQGIQSVLTSFSADGHVRNRHSDSGQGAGGSVQTFQGAYTVEDEDAYVIISGWVENNTISLTLSFMEKSFKPDENKKEIVEIQSQLENITILNHWAGKKWVAFGTSITDDKHVNEFDPGYQEEVREKCIKMGADIDALIAQYGSMTAVIQSGEVNNVIQTIDTSDYVTGKYPKYLLEMSELSTNNFRNFGVAGGSFCKHVLYQICTRTSDEANADLVTIEGAVNDFAGAVPLGDVGDTLPFLKDTDSGNTVSDYIRSIGGSEKGTFAGACYQIFKRAIENSPNATVVLLTEHTGRVGPVTVSYADWTQLRKNSLDLYQKDYIDMTKKIADFIGIPVIEAGKDSMINGQNPQYMVDHLHHSQLGGKQYARTIWARLKDIPLKVITL